MFGRIATVVASVSALAGSALGVVISASQLPCTSNCSTSFGYDICTVQSVAIMMYPTRDYNVDSVQLWLFDTNSSSTDPVTVTIREGNDAGPSNRILETIYFTAPSTAVLEPQSVTLQSAVRPLLRANRTYWLVVESPQLVGQASSWAAAARGGGLFTTGRNGTWQQLQYGRWGAHRVEGTEAATGNCPSDLDNGSGTGTPDGGVGYEDLAFYLSIYQAGDNRADLDDGTRSGNSDGGVGVEDLLYFLDRYNAGC